ncbi:hypothetical protein ACH47B_28990 [Rhodococcus sp. NPDC019627]|uniref:hypothetical protein n=1 Tax=unclassified Rhodococcus (in: high G+C Gram-positive bacteria) TaxID=192944 RepID=UPI0033D25B62
MLDEVGIIPGDRIEHGAPIPADAIDDFHRRGLTIVIQPGFLEHAGSSGRAQDTAAHPSAGSAAALLERNQRRVQ